MPEAHTRIDELRERQAEARAHAAQELDLDDTGSPAHLAQVEIDNCRRCDDEGYHGNRVCDHREHSTPAGRAAAMEMFRESQNGGAA